MEKRAAETKPVIYQLIVRLFSNTNETRKKDGTLAENGCGRFSDIDEKALAGIVDLGANCIWLTGVLRQATLTDYSEVGLLPDHADVVKGRAGSFYAIRDYYDVCPDYAIDPRRRLEEFEALVRRIHDAGLRVLIDLVPNHVARGYGSVLFPERDFGLGDDQSKFFDRDNSFFYLTEPRGQRLALDRPAHWNPEGVAFDGAFPQEDGAPSRTPRATGNNVTSAHPSATDWYETVKLNYGHDFTDPEASSYDPTPAVWKKIDLILSYWQDKGVDGFRVDFAHWVPLEAWRYLLRRLKDRDPRALVIAEAYDLLPQLVEAGFDAVYRDEAYDTLKRIYLGRATLDDLDRLFDSLDDQARGRYVHYLENHDERRIASPLVLGDDPDASGFGSAKAGPHLAPILFLYGSGPILFYNGQEVAEPADGEEGFGGKDGRTSIFDYWSMAELSKWVNGHRYDGGRCSDEQLALRAYYRDLLALCQAPEVRGDGYWGLRYLNRQDALFPFARFVRGGGSLLVVVANFALGARSSGSIRIPAALAEAAGLPSGPLEVRLILDEKGKGGAAIAVLDDSALESAGFVAEVADQATNVYRIGP